LRRVDQVVERPLHGGVLDRIELEAPHRRVEREQEPAPAGAEEAFLRGALAGEGHAVPRSARLTALRTIGSLSAAARSSSCRASGVPTCPSASAAQARVSGGSFIRSMPRPSSMAPSGLIAAGPAMAP